MSDIPGKVRNLQKMLREGAERLDKHDKNVKVARIAGSSVGILCSVGAIIAGATIPVTFGVSAGPMIACIVFGSVGAAGGLTSSFAVLTGSLINRKKKKELEKIWQELREELGVRKDLQDLAGVPSPADNLEKVTDKIGSEGQVVKSLVETAIKGLSESAGIAVAGTECGSATSAAAGVTSVAVDASAAGGTASAVAVAKSSTVTAFAVASKTGTNAAVVVTKSSTTVAVAAAKSGTTAFAAAATKSGTNVAAAAAKSGTTAAAAAKSGTTAAAAAAAKSGNAAAATATSAGANTAAQTASTGVRLGSSVVAVTAPIIALNALTLAVNIWDLVTAARALKKETGSAAGDYLRLVAEGLEVFISSKPESKAKEIVMEKNEKDHDETEQKEALDHNDNEMGQDQTDHDDDNGQDDTVEDGM